MAGFATAAFGGVVGGVVGSFTKKGFDRADPWIDELLSPAKPSEQLEDEICFLRGILPKLKEAIWSAELRDETAEVHGAFRSFVEDAEDILDEFDTPTATPTAQHGLLNQAADLVRRLTPSNSNFRDQIKGLYDRLEKVKSDVDKRRLFVASANEGLRLAKKEDEGVTRRSTTYELLPKNFGFVGREKTKKEIMAELLMSRPSSSEPTVVLVTGMGGVGKTTLVQDILRQGSIKGHFDYMKWVCVGDELDLKIVTRKILDNDKEDVMEIHSKLNGKRFLIVLDDCWRGKMKSWEELWVPLTYGGDGSKVIVTSREDISSELLPAFVKKYELGSLSNEECLQIFESYAFPNKGASGSSSTSRLQNNEEKILNEKIKGVPLAARLLGSSLRNVNRGKWIDEAERIVQNDIMSVLMWSYRCLPWYLKQCFAYLSVFPKDYKLQKEHVVWMWMAHDYVQPEDEQTPENIGEKYFDDLVGASLIQKMQDDEESDVYYSMHDLVHDLAMKVSISGCFPYKHLSITDNKSSHGCFDNEKLRTLLIFRGDADITKLQLQYVRVLLISRREHLAQINFDEMTHLRYLDLRYFYGDADALTQSIYCMHQPYI